MPSENKLGEDITYLSSSTIQPSVQKKFGRTPGQIGGEGSGVERKRKHMSLPL